MKKLILLFSLFGLTAFGALTNIPIYVATNTALHTADGFYLIDSKMPESLWALIINRNMEQMEWLKPDRTNGVMSKLTVNDWLQVNGTMTNADPVVMGSTLDVEGDVTFEADLDVYEDLHVGGVTELDSTLDVMGDTTLSNAVVTGTLGVTGATELGTTLGVTGDTVLGSDLTVSNNATVGGTLDVAGVLTTTTTIDATDGIDAAGVQSTFGSNGLASSGPIAANGGLTVANGQATVLNGTLTVDDDKTTLGGGLEVTGAVQLNDAVVASNVLTVVGTLTASGGITGDTTLADDLTVEGDSEVVDIVVSGTADIIGDTVVSNLTVNGDLEVLGDVETFDVADGAVSFVKLDTALVIDDDTLGTASTTNLPTSESVKAYVDYYSMQYVYNSIYHATPSETNAFDNTIDVGYELNNSAPIRERILLVLKAIKSHTGGSQTLRFKPFGESDYGDRTSGASSAYFDSNDDNLAVQVVVTTGSNGKIKFDTDGDSQDTEIIVISYQIMQ